MEKENASNASQANSGYEYDVSATGVVTVPSFCSKEMIAVDMKVGGKGHVVEIDETSLAKKRKYARGKKHDDFWVFGGYDRTSKKWFATVTFHDRTKSTLVEVIKATILPETHIISDKFGSYVSTNERHTLANNTFLKEMKYKHSWVNHKHFVDPNTGAHTNSIEGCWEAKLKSKIKAMRGTMTMEQTCAIVDECLWRSWFFRPGASSEQLFKGLVTAIIKHQS
ncbi:hypothetical protein ATCC90586_010959 [Pythium insidiosum]|nr:hypothetical protein ATCC90586_010959 [Pythium insidiosum]